MDIKRLTEIEERCEKATPGPWEMAEPSETEDCGLDHGWSHFSCYDINSSTAKVEVAYGDEPRSFPASVISSWGHDADGVEAKLADIQFIAHARTDVPDLVAYCKSLRSEAAELARAASHIRHWHDSEPDGMVVSSAAVRELWELLSRPSIAELLGGK